MYFIVTMLVFLVVEMNPYNLTGQCPPPRGDNLEKLSTVVIFFLLISQKLSLEMKRKLFCLFVLSLPLLPVLLPTNYNSKKLFSFIRFLVAGLTCIHFQVIADFLFFGTAVLNSRTY